MKNFMTSGSLTRDRELHEDLGGRGTAPFPRKDVIMMVYDRRPPLWRHYVSKLSPRTPTRCS
jgi:hypothetical protein